MLAFRRFNNRLVLGTQTSSKTGAAVVYELKEQKPALLKIPREISGYLLLSPGSIKKIPLPHNYDRTTERLYVMMRVQGIAKFSIITGNSASNILIKGTPAQQGRYAICDFFTSVIGINPSLNDNVQIQYTMFVVPDLSVDNNFYGLVSPLVTPGNSGGTGIMASNCCARVSAGSSRLDYLASPVTTGSWTTLIGSVSASVTNLYVFDSSGETMEIGIGASGSETRIFLVAPGGPGPVDIVVNAGERISVRAVSNTASIGEIIVNAFS